MPAVPPVIPDSQELYNALMSKIEPELCTDQIPLLTEKYKDEAQEQRTARIKRYNAAFEAYDKALDVYMTSLRRKVDVYRKQALGEAEKNSRSEEQNKLSQLETMFSH